MDKKLVFVWALYDFANSILIINGILYFSQWIVVDNNLPDIWYAATFIVSTILLLVTSSIFGAWSDKVGKRMPFLIVTTALAGVFGIGTPLSGQLIEHPFLRVAVPIAIYTLGIYVYQLSLIFYNALISSVANRANFAKVAGIGEMAGNLGFLAGGIITLPIIMGGVTFFGGSGRLQTLYPASLVFILLSLPLFFFFKEKHFTKTVKVAISLKETLAALGKLQKIRGVIPFLLAYYLASDALLTFGGFFPIYLEKVLHLSDQEKFYFLTFSTIFFALGAITLGYLADRIGLVKGFFLTVLVTAVFFVAISPIRYIPAFLIMAEVISISWGSMYVFMRSLYARLVPEGQHGISFSIYAMFSRFASIVGPLVWSMTVLLLAGIGDNVRYSVAVFVLSVLLFVALPFIRKIPEPRI